VSDFDANGPGGVPFGGGFGAPPGGPPPGAGAAHPGDTPLGVIQFSPEEEATIRQMARFMNISAFLMVAGSVLSILGGLAKGLMVHAQGLVMVGQICGGLFGGIVIGGLAFVLMQGAKAFRDVVDSDGSDQDHLAKGLDKLKIYFMAKGILTILLTLLACGAFIVAIAVGAGMASRFH